MGDTQIKELLMLKMMAILLGLVFLAVGVLGFLPEYAPSGKLFNLFSATPQHNSMHLVVGFIAILCGLSSSTAAKVFFIFFGLAYAALAAHSFYHGEGILFGAFNVTKADTWLYTGIAAVFLFLGFKLKRS